MYAQHVAIVLWCHITYASRIGYSTANCYVRGSYHTSCISFNLYCFLGIYCCGSVLSVSMPISNESARAITVSIEAFAWVLHSSLLIVARDTPLCWASSRCSIARSVRYCLRNIMFNSLFYCCVQYTFYHVTPHLSILNCNASLFSSSLMVVRRSTITSCPSRSGFTNSFLSYTSSPK